MRAQILVDGEVEDLAGRITNAVLTALVDMAGEVTDPQAHAAVWTFVVAVRERLAQTPVDPEPLMKAILRGDPSVPVETPLPTVIAAPSYWPAVPEISDELFARYAADSQEPEADPVEQPWWTLAEAEPTTSY